MIVIDNNSHIPLYKQIYNQIKEDIISGEISEGSRLTSTRTLSNTLNVSRNTVESAYSQLCSEGYIESKAGSGFIALKYDSAIISRVKREVPEKVIEEKKQLFEMDPVTNCKYDFRYANISIPDFPMRLWRKVSNKCLASISSEDMATYGNRKGELELRIELMKYLEESRGVACRPEQIIIGSGSEYCLGLICQLFKKNNKQIALEDPGYFGAREIFLNNGYEVIPISLEKDGINVEELENSSAKIVYVTPSHQLPMGTVMPIQKRLKLLDWAVRNNGIIIEDDYDSELRYNSRPVPSVQSISSRANVVYIGTFSKALSPSLRVDYMVIPEAYLDAFDETFRTYQVSVPLIQQRIIQEFMHLGHWSSHLRKVTLANKNKHDILINSIQEFMGDRVIIHGKNAGLHIVLEVNNGLSEQDLIKRAEAHEVKVYPVSMFWMRKDSYSDNMIQLGFGAIPEEHIAEGIRNLSRAWFEK